MKEFADCRKAAKGGRATAKARYAGGGRADSALDQGSDRPETIKDSKPLAEPDDPWNNGGVEE